MQNANVLLTDKALIKKANEFAALYEKMTEGREEKAVHEILEQVYEVSGYKAMLEAEQTPEAEARMENVAELINSAYTYDADEGCFPGGLFTEYCAYYGP